MIAKIHCKVIIALAFLLLGSGMARAQFTDSGTGLLHAPSAEMNEDGTFMITNNFVNKHSISESYWGYHTFEYGFNVNLWSRLEIGYVCVILDGKRKANPSARDLIMFNQDRHFTAKVLLIREGDFGLSWMPAIAIGLSDPTTGAGGDYSKTKVDGEGNGFFNRYYAVATKHFKTPIGPIGAHLGYQFNQRTDFPMNGPCAAVSWQPEWLQHQGILDDVKVILEYDCRTVNMGFIASIWDNRFEAMFDLQNLQWINFGLRYKLRLKK